MYRKNEVFSTEIREAMRGGTGTVKIEHYYDEENELLSPARMVAKLTLEQGSSIGFHRHDGEEEIFIVLRGVMELDDDGKETVILRAGDSVLTGNGAGHAVKNIGSETLEILAIINLFK